MTTSPIGIIGGSGVYTLDAITGEQQIAIQTPFGDPSDLYLTGKLGDRPVVFLPRHGRGHRISPSQLNYRANIFGFKKLGVEHLLAVTAVGSLKEEIRPLDIVVPDQLFDRTYRRENTFFGNGMVAHVGFGDPICPALAATLTATAKAEGARVHSGGSLVCIEGPAFSTRAESELYRQWGMSIVGMTTVQEAKLAREAEICYAALAMVTDYDCWHSEADAVTVDTVVANATQNAALARRVTQEAILKIRGPRTCACASALDGAIMTDPAQIPDKIKTKLAPLLTKYLTV